MSLHNSSEDEASVEAEAALPVQAATMPAGEDQSRQGESLPRFDPSLANVTAIGDEGAGAAVACDPPEAVAADDFADVGPSPLAENSSSEAIYGLTAGDRTFLTVAGVVILLLCVVHWGRLSGWGRQEVEINRLPERRLDYWIDINHATWVEWMQLEGIGELTARKIVADRAERGPFDSIDAVQRVAGIGPKTMHSLRPFLRCRDCESPAPTESAAGQ